MIMIVEDNYTVQLDGIWLKGKPQIEAALAHVHAVDPKAGVSLIGSRRTEISDMNAVEDMLEKAGISHSFPDFY